MHVLVPLLLMPLCAWLNHLGGQSVVVPYPRFVCRMLGQGVAFGLVALLSGLGWQLSLMSGIFSIAGVSFWAVWKNGPEFMSVNFEDHRLYGTPWYTPNRWITAACDWLTGHTSVSKLTPSKCCDWGTLYGTLLGAFMYPLFVGLAGLLTPWAAVFGLSCLSQGLIYRASGAVYRAEYAVGAGVIGGSLALTLIAYILQSPT